MSVIYPLHFHRRVDRLWTLREKKQRSVPVPIEQPIKFELIANLKTAKAIGVELPTAILLRANEVIE